MDDVDFEVTDLRSAGFPDPPRLPIIPLRRLSVRQRLARAVIILCLLAAALAPLLAVSPDAARTMAEWLHVPTPPRPTPLPLGADTFLLANTVPWGDLELDGHSAATLGIALHWPYAGDQVPTFTLAPGGHELVYRADPFWPLRCQVSVPAAVTDTCPLLSADPSPLVPPFGSRILDARALPAYLPVSAFAALADAVQERLAAWTGTALVAPGDHYLNVDGQVAIASRGAQATLHYRVNHDARASQPTPNGDCISLCSFSSARSQLDADDWRLVANVTSRWDYAQADGQTVTAPAAPIGSDAHALVPVTARWTGRWRVDTPPDEALVDAPPCQVALNILGRLSASTAALNALASGSWGTYVTPPAAAGCLIVTRPAMNAAGQPSGETIQTLYRFGVLLAANAGAEQAFGQLTQVNATEQALVSRLAPPGAR